MKPLVSVIVPIYNVQPWLRQCLDSLKNQTLKEIEVICIDDGSTDESGAIADEYGRADPRFRIIHHGKNRGLSAARNTGIDEATAEYLMFVDSDDWVDEKLCEIPYRTAIDNNSDIVIFNYYENKGRRERSNVTHTSGLIEHETAIDIGNTLAWNKLYRRKFFDTIRYPEGHVYEDVSITHKLIYKAERINWRQECLYHHRFRKGSISRSPSSRIDEYAAKIERYKELIDFGYPKSKAVVQLYQASLAYCGHASSKEALLYETAERTVDDIKGIPVGFNRRYKAMLLIWRTNKDLYRAIYRMLGKRMKETVG